MRIHMHSHVFPPSVGGVETVGYLLASEWTRQGAEVRVTTETEAGDTSMEFDYPVVHRPPSAGLYELARWADIVFHNHPSLRAAWAPLLARKPWFAAVHTWLPCFQSGSGISMLRRGVLKSCRFLAVSAAIAGHLPAGGTQRVPNPYRADLYRMDDSAEKDLDLLFVGRLVSDKGGTVLLEAMAKLKDAGCRPRLEIIGGGPERPLLESMCNNHGLQDQLVFSGTLPAEAVASRMRCARFTVIPSVWQEPFGLVALEALACGSVPVAARVGGLPEAAGDFGVYFKAGDANSLAVKLAELLDGKSSPPPRGDALNEHLRQHQPEHVAKRYLEIFNHPLR